jgi:hypothetical protein
MKIFHPITFAWWQMGLLKLSMVCLGIILGVYFSAFFLRWIVLVTLLFALPAVYLLSVWWRQ